MKQDILIDQLAYLLEGEIGPFPGRVKPLRCGLYKRITRKGNVVWSWYGNDNRWGMFSSDKRKAVAKRFKPSKHQELRWIGLARS